MHKGSALIYITGESRVSTDATEQLLAEWGFRVTTAFEEGSYTVIPPAIIPDCIIIDVKSPDERFVELCRWLKNDPLLSDVPVVFLGTEVNDVLMESCFDAGAADFIVKPFRREEFLARIRNHVAMCGMKKQLEEKVQERTAELIKTNELLIGKVEEYKHILKDLQENETLLLTIALNIPNSYLAIIERDYTVGFASGQEFRKIKVDPWRLIGLPVERIFRDKAEIVKSNVDKTFAGAESSFEIFFNNQYQFYKTVPLTDGAGEVQRVLMVAENITSRKEFENRIIESLKEKETLLREIHHRVKNNMQLISSLLSLQAESSRNSELEDIFRTLQNRIFSMSLVHEKLYHYKQFSRINFREYIKDLIVEIQKALDDENFNHVIFNLNLENEYLSIERAVPCGLILNELVMNSFKHAFADKSGCRIDVEFTRDDSEFLSLVVRDNGVGLPGDFDILKSESMGMVLLRELTAQLHGKIFINSAPGTEFRIVFGPDKSESLYRPEAVENRDARKILIVEDERIISTMLKKIIREEGYSLSGCVASGKEAIKFALNDHPDLVIMDIVLEDEIDGVEAARIITGEIDVPVIFLTGNSDEATLKAAREIKPYDMLTKPVRKNHLVDVIKTALK